MNELRIEGPDDPALDELCDRLRQLASGLDRPGAWVGEQLTLCGRYGVYRWFLPQSWGGLQWGESEVTRGYLKLSAACLTTTFVITQRMGACRRLVVGENQPLAERLLPKLLTGSAFATVGISHLTTSRRHLGTPAMRAEQSGAGFVLEGYSPWVTGAAHADHVVVGAELDDGRQVLVCLPTRREGVTVGQPADLIGLTASQTGPLTCRRVRVSPDDLVAGPIPDVMQSGAGAQTGGLQTSTLALGVAWAATDFLSEQSAQRPDLREAAQSLQHEGKQLQADLHAAAAGAPVCSNQHLRTRANSLVLRASQAALAAAKGAGYVVGHPAGRWCQQALFFLVWSCPQPVLNANLCELAGIEV